MKTIKILNYAVNGLGMGHISRLISINRWIRRITGALGINTEIFFLTSSESDSLAYQNGFASFKIPSRNAVRETGITQTRYRKIAKQWIWNAINLCSPDILIVDTFPYGSFHELFDVMDFGFKKVFIYRAIKEEISNRPDFQKSLFGYDKIIIPLEDSIEKYILPDSLKDRISTTGEILIRDRDELHSRELARQFLGLEKEKLACYVTAGGGGDPEIEKTLFSLTETLKNFGDIQFVIGAGPLYKGKEFHYPNISWIFRYNIMEHFNAFDFAVSAGGYNSTYELLYTGIPTIFFHQERLYDDQEKRIRNLSEQEACIRIDSNLMSDLSTSINTLRDSLLRNKYKINAQKIVPENHAYTAAKIILEDFIPEEDFEHIKDFIRGSYFYSLKEANIPETIGLKAINAFDFSYQNLQKQKNAVKYVSDFLDLSNSKAADLKKITENLFTDFMDYPLNNLSLGFLKYLQNKSILLETGIKFLSIYIQNNTSVGKSIQDLMLNSIKQIELFYAQGGNIEDKLANYILFNNKDSENTSV